METKIIRREPIGNVHAPEMVELVLVEHPTTGKRAVVTFDHSHNQVLGTTDGGGAFFAPVLF